MSNSLLHNPVVGKRESTAPEHEPHPVARGSMPIGATRRRLAGIAVTAASIAAMTTVASWPPATATAAPPVVVAEGEFDNVYPVSADDFACDVDVVIHETGRLRITEYSDGDGNLTQVHVHVDGTTRVTSDYGESVDRWVENHTYDAEALTYTLAGNIYNVHAGAGGILVNDSGRVVLDATTDEPITIQGPHQALAGDIGDLCAVLGGH